MITVAKAGIIKFNLNHDLKVVATQNTTTLNFIKNISALFVAEKNDSVRSQMFVEIDFIKKNDPVGVEQKKCARCGGKLPGFLHTPALKRHPSQWGIINSFSLTRQILRI